MIVFSFLKNRLRARESGKSQRRQSCKFQIFTFNSIFFMVEQKADLQSSIITSRLHLLSNFDCGFFKVNSVQEKLERVERRQKKIKI